MTVRVEVVTPFCVECDGTGVDGSTYVPATHLKPSELEPCPVCRGSGGGSRRTFTEWPPEAIEAAAEAIKTEWSNGGTGWHAEILAERALAAAWGHITGDNK